MYRHWNYYLFVPSQIQTYLSLITTTHTLTNAVLIPVYMYKGIL